LAEIKRKRNTSKSKGSAFEREMAKELSMWIYKKPSIVRRHPTSGAEKDYSQGSDIGVFQPGEKELELYIELKCGYTEKIDIINARKQIIEWVEKAKKNNKKNYPVWLIWKLLNRGIILASTKPITGTNLKELYICDNLYIYDFKEVLKYKFEELKV